MLNHGVDQKHPTGHSVNESKYSDEEYEVTKDSPYDCLGLGHTLFRGFQNFLRNWFCIFMLMMIVAIVLDYLNIAKSDIVLQPTTPNKMSLTN